MVKKYVAINIRELVKNINDYVIMAKDMGIEIDVNITKTKEGTFSVSIKEEV
jgi:ribosomal protein L11